MFLVIILLNDMNPKPDVGKSKHFIDYKGIKWLNLNNDENKSFLKIIWFTKRKEKKRKFPKNIPTLNDRVFIEFYE